MSSIDRNTTIQGQYQPSTDKAKSQLAVVNTPELYNYSNSISLRLTDIQQELYNEVKKHVHGGMAGSVDDAQYIRWLLETMNAITVIEVGVFLGSTTLSIALAKSVNKIHALDINDTYVNIGRPYWDRAGISNKIDVRLGSAIDSLQQLINDGYSNTIDFIFIDADKENYDKYYELSIELIRQGGVIAIDNVYWHGNVLKPDNQINDSKDTQVIKTLNQKIHNDKRVDITILPLADGLTLCRKL